MAYNLMYMECSEKCDLHLRKESAKFPEIIYTQKSKLPSGSISISTQGDQLIIRPSSPYRYNLSPKNEETSFCTSIEEIKDLNQHQRSTTTIINDISQSYTFLQGYDRSRDNISEEFSQDKDLEELCNDMKDSEMVSTMDPKSFIKNPDLTPKHFSTVFTVSSPMNEEPNLVKAGKKVKKHKLIEPVTAFCSKCGENVKTLVVKKVYTGGL